MKRREKDPPPQPSTLSVKPLSRNLYRSCIWKLNSPCAPFSARLRCHSQPRLEMRPHAEGLSEGTP